MKIIISLLVTIVLFLVTHIASAGLIVSETSGSLLGAERIEINGGYYDVSFLDGSCSSLFSGCDEGNDFFWQTADDALAASNALLEQALIDSDVGRFDSNPELINGCRATYYCQISTTFNIKKTGFAQVSWLTNESSARERAGFTDNANVSVGWEGWPKNKFFSDYPHRVYAVWSHSKSTVTSFTDSLIFPLELSTDNIQDNTKRVNISEPASLTIFSLCLIALVSIRFKR